MKCENCNEEFPVGEYKDILYSLRTHRIIYFCSKGCLEEFEEEYPSAQFIRTNEGGENE